MTRDAWGFPLSQGPLWARNPRRSHWIRPEEREQVPVLHEDGDLSLCRWGLCVDDDHWVSTCASPMRIGSGSVVRSNSMVPDCPPPVHSTTQWLVAVTW